MSLQPYKESLHRRIRTPMEVKMELSDENEAATYKANTECFSLVFITLGYSFPTPE